MLNKVLFLLSIVCISLLIWINFIDFKFIALFRGTASKIEYFIETISLSYLASYIFFILNIYLVERKERKNILPYISRYVLLIIVNNYSIIECLKNERKTFGSIPTLEEFKFLLRNINLEEKIPFYYKNENFIFLLKNRKESTLETINKIFLSGKYIDAKLYRLLLEINNSLYFNDLQNLEKIKLEEYSRVFYNFFLLINELKIYYDNNLKKYKMEGYEYIR